MNFRFYFSALERDKEIGCFRRSPFWRSLQRNIKNNFHSPFPASTLEIKVLPRRYKKMRDEGKDDKPVIKSLSLSLN